MNPVSCAQCQYFLPDTIGSGDGIGKCRIYEHYASKGLPDKKLNKLFIQLGNKLFWCGTDTDKKDRYCDKYKKRIEHD